MLQSQIVPPVALESSILDGDLRIGDFVVRPLLKVVRPEDQDAGKGERTLPDKAMAVLVYLAQNARQVCRRDDILDAVWGPEREAYDRVLDNAIREIRKALDDDARSPKYVQTIPKKGYRLLVPVESRLLEKQRDASGEFVPHASTPGEVYRRVRKPGAAVERAADRTEPHRASDAHPASTAPGPGRKKDRKKEESRHGSRDRRRGSRRTVLLLSSAALAAVLVVSLWLNWRSGRLFVALDLDGFDRASNSAGGAGAGLETVRVALAEALFEDPACGEVSLYRPATFLGPADVEIKIQPNPHDSEDDLLIAEVRGDAERSPVVLLDLQFLRNFPEASAAGFSREVVQHLDAVACRSETGDDDARACHCLQSTQDLESPPFPEPLFENLERALDLDPDLIPAYAALARTYRRVGRSDRASEVLNAGLGRIEDPSSTEALTLRLELARSLYDEVNQLQLLEELRTRQPENPQWPLGEARLLAIYSQDCERAKKLVEGPLARSPRSDATTLFGTTVLWLCGDAESVLRILTDQIQTLPRKSNLRQWLTAVLSLTGRYEEAMDQAQQVMTLEPESPESYWLMGKLADRRGRLAEAESWYRESLARSTWPQHRIRARVGLARTAWLAGDLDGCLDQVRNLEDAPFFDAFEFPGWVRGMCSLEAGRIDHARSALSEMKSSFRGPSTTSWRAAVLLLEGKIALATADSRESAAQAVATIVDAAKSNPLQADYFAVEAGRALRDVGEDEAARVWFAKVLDLNPRSPWALCELGEFQVERGEIESGLANLRSGSQLFGRESSAVAAKRCREMLEAAEA